jgi:fructose-1,6-bisphosphatase/inositol monophosphatase family enzyme
MPRLPDAERVAAIIAEVAAEAVVPRFRALVAGEVSEKTGPADIVTVADLEAERLLSQRLGALAPAAAVVGEEAVAARPELVGALKERGAAWLIDPVDGTANFAAGLPLFAVMVAYVVDGRAVDAWIHDPLRGVTAIAERGGGAWAEGRRLAMAKRASLGHMTGAVNFRFGDRALVARMAARADRIGSVLILRCAGQEYLALLEGRLDFAIYHRVMPWDHAPGALLVAEAGGETRRLDGERYEAAADPWRSPLLVAPDAERWQWIYDGLIAG